jgi:uncharacterized integral membrane protein
MADPNHLPEMHSLDTATVILYRTGLSVFAASTALQAIELLSGQPVLGRWHLPVMAAGMALASANLHLYDPKFRWFFPLMSWLGFMVLAFAMQVQSAVMAERLSVVSLGFFYAGAAMLAMKESFCFKIPGLPLVPFLLAGAVALRAAALDRAAGAVLAAAGLICLWLSYAKWTMPLHFDIGDKSQYKI